MTASRTIRLRQDRAGRGLDPGIFKAWRYSDGWIDDARLVVALLRDAQDRGATPYPRVAATSAARRADGWQLTLSDGRNVQARQTGTATRPRDQATARTGL